MKSVRYLFLIFSVSEFFEKIKCDELSDDFRNKFAKASYDFTLDFLKNGGLEDKDNILLSPSSISVVLAILQQGATGNTAYQLEKVLRLSANDSKLGYGHVIKSLQRKKTNLTLEWGTRAYVVSGYQLEDDYLQTIEENFNATIEELDLTKSSPTEAAARINDWVKEASRDNIKDLVDACEYNPRTFTEACFAPASFNSSNPALLTPDLVMLIVNAIFFKSVWDSPFQKYKTRIDKFQISHDEKVEVPFMKQAGNFMSGEDADLGIKWTELPFEDENFSMIFILPIKTHGLNQVVEKLSGSDLKRIIGSKSLRRVRLTIPKFKLSKKVSLAKTLKKLGLTDVFNSESNLKGISKGNNTLQLSHLIHQADIEIDEDGSTAAAATFEIVQTLSFEWFADELHFKANHPFLFFIVDKLNEIPIFAGKVVHPKTSF